MSTRQFDWGPLSQGRENEAVRNATNEVVIDCAIPENVTNGPTTYMQVQPMGWGHWADKGCVNGYRESVRKCDHEPCVGSTVNRTSCKEYEWGDWSDYGTCESGYQMSTRPCVRWNGNYVDSSFCDDSASESIKCVGTSDNVLDGFDWCQYLVVFIAFIFVVFLIYVWSSGKFNNTQNRKNQKVAMKKAIEEQINNKMQSG